MIYQEDPRRDLLYNMLK